MSELIFCYHSVGKFTFSFGFRVYSQHIFYSVAIKSEDDAHSKKKARKLVRDRYVNGKFKVIDKPAGVGRQDIVDIIEEDFRHSLRKPIVSSHIFGLNLRSFMARRIGE